MFSRRKLCRNRITTGALFVCGVTMMYFVISHSGSSTSTRDSRRNYGDTSMGAMVMNSDKETDLNNFKYHLIRMRSFLSKMSNSTSYGSNRSGDNTLAEFDDKGFGEEKLLLEQYADTFAEIGKFVERSGKDRDRGPEVDRQMRGGDDVIDQADRQMVRIPGSKRKNNVIDQVERQKENIRQWDQVYENFDQSESTGQGEQKDNLDRLDKLLQNWDPFYIVFPNEQSQDRILIHFQIPEEAVEDLNTQVVKMESRREKFTLPKATQLNTYPDSTKSWKIWHSHITQYEIYNPEDPAFKQVLVEMNKSPIQDAYLPSGGTQQKLVFYLETGLRVIFKPMRFPRKQEALPDHMFWRDYERHIAEIAAFNLDRVLGFHHVPPVVGRYINVTQDVRRFADEDLQKTFFISPAGNICFYGTCQYYCDTAHAVCGRPEILEGSVMAYLPTSSHVTRTSWRHPWRRSYSKRHQKAVWQEDYHYCDGVRNKQPYNTGRRLLDLMDMAAFDFMSGNMDRHHYETFDKFDAHGNLSSPILFDNGRGYGKSRHDELTIMAPIYQCCLMRYSTLKKLLSFHKGPQHLSDVMRETLSKDVASPILLEGHLKALDRRLDMILFTIHRCVKNKGFHNVVKDDGL